MCSSKGSPAIFWSPWASDLYLSPFHQKKQGCTYTARRVTIWQLHIYLKMVFSSRNKNPSFAEISRKFSAVRWFNKTEDCIFSCSLILRSNVQSFIISPYFNLAISPTLTILFLFIYPFWKYTPSACIWDFFRAYLVHCKSIALIFTETNGIQTLHSWHELLTQSWMH